MPESSEVPAQSLPNKNPGASNLVVKAAVGGVAIALLGLLTLNYFGILPLNEVYPGLSFLPRKGASKAPAGTLENARTSNPVPLGGMIFTPGLTAASSGKLVDNYTILYTLKGKVQKVEQNGGKYDVTVGAFDGSQTYKMNGLSGEGILKKMNKPLDWKDLKAGSDVIVELNVNSPKTIDGQPTVLVAQIQVVASP
ncbi:MAG: hypothetical protein Q7S79_02430 [bacterium]|nr:hypothetical protein [bacterium]